MEEKKKTTWADVSSQWKEFCGYARQFFMIRLLPKELKWELNKRELGIPSIPILTSTKKCTLEDGQEGVWLDDVDAERLLLWIKHVEDALYPTCREHLCSPDQVCPERAEEMLRRVFPMLEKKAVKTANRWEKHLEVAVKLAVYCLEQYGKDGKPITKRQYEAELKSQKLPMLNDKAERAFRRSMPYDVLERGGEKQ